MTENGITSLFQGKQYEEALKAWYENRPEDYTEIPAEDTFFDSKLIVYRMNLRAALATRMRLNRWEGNCAAANKDVQTLKDNYQLTWIAESDLLKAKKEQDLAFSKEMLFGLEGFKRYESVIEPLFRRYIGNEINKNPQLVSLLNRGPMRFMKEIKGFPLRIGVVFIGGKNQKRLMPLKNSMRRKEWCIATIFPC